MKARTVLLLVIIWFVVGKGYDKDEYGHRIGCHVYVGDHDTFHDSVVVRRLSIPCADYGRYKLGAWGPRV